ncbi:hypothetical protein [Rhodococcus opacus]|uniref:hypothetical protein n=1 Tax=Rhodococcus opacus TaxID=37919 RepID=UPI0029550CFC|nr:hypothetical protein [Rhodococcus opacus]
MRDGKKPVAEVAGVFRQSRVHFFSAAPRQRVEDALYARAEQTRRALAIAASQGADIAVAGRSPHALDVVAAHAPGAEHHPSGRPR